PLRHGCRAAGQAAFVEESTHVALVAIVRALGAARCRRDIAQLHVAVGKGTLEVVEESLLQLSGDAVGVVAVNVGDVNYLLASSWAKSRGTTGLRQRSVEDATVTITSLRTSQGDVRIERIRQRLGVQSFKSADESVAEAVIVPECDLLILGGADIGIDGGDARHRRVGSSRPDGSST